MFPRLTVKKQSATRISRGHLWIFSNDVQSVEGVPPQGSEVSVYTPEGESLGTALFNKHALIMARMVSRAVEPFTNNILAERFHKAIARRKHWYPERTALRLLFSEADQLPGLVIDRYGSVIVVQFLTLAMDIRRDVILGLIRGEFPGYTIVERSEGTGRTNEGLPEVSAVLEGEIPEAHIVDIDGIPFRVEPLTGQKTGIYLDQVENWLLARRFAKGRKVLDLFSNVGGFSLNAAKGGATEVRAVDSSESALSLLMFSAAHAELSDKIRAKKSDAFLYVRSQPEMFDLIICDPPAFAKSRKQLDGALRGYRELNRQCLKMLNPGGILITASCSAAVSDSDFETMLQISANDAERQVRMLPGGGQPIDHAPLLSMPETRYLKLKVLEVL